jgi:hypothetical protein
MRKARIIFIITLLHDNTTLMLPFDIMPGDRAIVNYLSKEYRTIKTRYFNAVVNGSTVVWIEEV